jgi:alpha-amylase
MLDLIRRHEGRFKIAYSITGVILEQFQEYTPEVLASFQELAETGCVEFLAETYYHSLSFLFSPKEFAAQMTPIKAHRTSARRPRLPEHQLVYNNAWRRPSSRLGA